jgi:hypothetical protein
MGVMRWPCDAEASQGVVQAADLEDADPAALLPLLLQEVVVDLLVGKVHLFEKRLGTAAIMGALPAPGQLHGRG